MSGKFDIDPGCLPLFSVTMLKDTVVYKGFENNITKFDHNSKIPCWFALEKVESSKYGTNIVTLKTTKTLKLINISSTLFKSHLVDQLNYFDYPDKETILFTLGIPNIDEQVKIIEQNISNPNDRKLNLCKQNAKLKSKVDYFDGHSRYSGKTLDDMMVSCINAIYGKHVDGYIQKHPVPSCWHGNFPSELCIFNVSKHVMTEIKIGAVKGGARPTTRTKFLENRECTEKEWQQMNENIFRKWGVAEKDIVKYSKPGAHLPLSKVPWKKHVPSADEVCITRMPDWKIY